MSELLLCSQTLSPSALQAQCGVNIDQLSTFNCPAPPIASANKPYLISNKKDGSNFKILNQLSPTPIAIEITNLSLSYGSDNMLALSEITSKLREYNIGLMGASTSVYANRIGGFASSVQGYQIALFEYRKAIKSNSPLKAAAKQKAYQEFHKMQGQFQNELRTTTSHIKAKRGIPLTNFNRATRIAESSRSATKLEVANQIQATKLVKFANHAKFLGNGLALIDFGSRLGNIHSSYQSDGSWERDMFIESSSFALSAIAGTTTVNVGTSALTFLMVATPVGWVGLIIGGAVVAGVAAGASLVINNEVKNNSGAIYDAIINWTN